MKRREEDAVCVFVVCIVFLGDVGAALPFLKSDCRMMVCCCWIIYFALDRSVADPRLVLCGWVVTDVNASAGECFHDANESSPRTK